MKLVKITATGTKGSLEANDAVFAAKVNDVLLSQSIRVYLANKRQGTSKVKTRGEIARTKKKWFKQKGTGNARHGARSANIFVGGGVAHGPKGNENWSLKLTPVLKKKALISALSAQAENIVVSDGLMSLSGKTKDAVALFNKVSSGETKILVIIVKSEENVIRSLRNIETVLIVSATRVNSLEIAMADKIVISPEAVKALEERLVVKAEPAKAEVKVAPAKKAVNPAKTDKSVKKTPAKKATKPAATKSKPKVTK